MVPRLVLPLLCVLLSKLHLGLGETTSTTSRLKLFASFSAPSPSASIATTATANASTANSSIEVAAAIKSASSDFVLISNIEAGRSTLQPLLAVEGYASTDSESLLYRGERWMLVQDGSFHERVPFRWARFQSTAASGAGDVTTTCLGVAEWNETQNDGDAGESTTTKRASTLLAYIAATCKASDIVAVALTSPASTADLATLQTRDVEAASERMIETSALLHEQQYLSSSVSISSLPGALSSRLFLRMATTTCIDKAATASSSSTGLALDLCSGADCKVCKPSNFAPGSDSAASSQSRNSKNHTLAIVISCGVFLAASVAVIFVLFRRQFFSSANTSKEEKDIATNLAYVLRI